MVILDSPALGVPRSEWEEWLAKLRAMKHNNPTVMFAIKRAESILERYDEREGAAQVQVADNEVPQR